MAKSKYLSLNQCAQVQVLRNEGCSFFVIISQLSVSKTVASQAFQHDMNF